METILNKMSDEDDVTTETTYRSQRRTWAGHGTGELCDVCRDPIGAEQIEYEVEMEGRSGTHALRLHFSCYQHWVRYQT